MISSVLIEGRAFPASMRKTGLSREVRARQLRHAEAGGEPRLPDERGIYLDAGKAPAWLGLTLLMLAFISRQTGV